MKNILPFQPFVLVTVLLWLNTISSEAATHTWAGAGLSGFWSLPANWAANNPPTAGEAAPVIITFPSGAARLNNTNNVAGLVIDQLNFTGTGYTINGSGSGATIILRGTGGTTVLNSASALNTVDNSIFLTLSNTVNFTINTNGSLILASVVQGSGSITKLGSGTLTLFADGADTYAGLTRVTTGILKLYCGTSGSPQLAVPGDLEIGGGSLDATVQLLANSQLAPAATLLVADNGLLDLNNFSTKCGPLTLSNSVVQSGNGTLTLGGSVTLSTNATAAIYGNLSLGGTNRNFDLQQATTLNLYAHLADGGNAAGFTVSNGSLYLYTNNTFSGWVTANAANLNPLHNLAFGSTNGGVILTNGSQLNLSGNNFTNEPLVCAVNADSFIYQYFTNLWSGSIQMQSRLFIYSLNSDDVLNLAGPISGAGSLHLIGNGLVRFTGTNANTFTGQLSASSNLELERTNVISVPGQLFVDYNTTTRLRTANQILDTAAVQVYGTLDLNNFSDTIGDFYGTGTVTLGSAHLTVGGGKALNTFSGVITGNSVSELDKINTNTLILSGTNTYSGNTFVWGGTLLVNGSQPASDVYVEPGATLGGNGTVRNLYTVGGNLSSGTSVEKLSCGSLTFFNGSTYFAELNGTNAGTTYDQINVTGTITINSGVTLAVAYKFVGAVSNQFVIANNDLSEAVSGIFTGLTNGATLSVNGTSFRINYNGGTGNDIVLTQLSPGGSSQFGSLSKLGNGSMHFTASGTANLFYTVQANTNLATTNWISIGTVVSDGSGNLQYTDGNAPSFQQRFYRFSYP